MESSVDKISVLHYVSPVAKSSLPTFVIVNPQAAGGRGMRLWPNLSDQLFHVIGKFEYDFTNATHAATILATKAAQEGYRRIIAVGGDGTVNEVLNGLFRDDDTLIHPDLTLGCLPVGSGTDFWKTLGIPVQLPAALQSLTGERTQLCDVGRVVLHAHDGKPLVRYFCNVADVGLGGEVIDQAKRLPRWGSGTINYMLASIAAFLQWQPSEVTVTVDGETLDPTEIIIAMIANGRYCGGGMCIAPEAKLDDGLFRLVLLRAVPKWQFVQLLPKLYNGRFDGHPAVLTRTAQAITIAGQRPLKVTLDGEVPGHLPATFTMLPRAMSIMV